MAVRLALRTAPLNTKFQRGSAELIVDWWQARSALEGTSPRVIGGLVLNAFSRLRRVAPSRFLLT